MEPEIILLTVPSAEECGIYITNIIWEKSVEELWNEICTKLSKYGLLYHVYVSPSKYKNDELNNYYALAKFYSKRAARKVLSQSEDFYINMKKVKIMKMPRDSFQSRFLKLNSHAMEELIVYYFGFNYWSLRVMDLQGVETIENEKEVKFICMVKVTTKDGLISEGIGVGKAPLTINHPGLVVTAYRTARKFAVENAKADALSKFVIIELANGKRLMDVNYQRPDEIPIKTRRDEVCCEVRNLCSDPEEDSFYHFDGFNESEWIENLSDTQLDNLLENS